MSIARRSADYGRALSDQSFAVTSGAAVGLVVPPGAISAVVSVSTTDARYRMVATAPTSTVGHLLVVGNQVEVYQNELPNFKIISTAGTNADVFVTYYGN